MARKENEEKSVLDEMRELHARMEELKQAATEEAMARVNADIELLNSMGHHFYLGNTNAATRTPRTPRPPRAEGGPPTNKGTVSDAPCPICDFKTSPPHDRRKHRSQEPKTPFTVQELEQLGLTRVE